MITAVSLIQVAIEVRRIRRNARATRPSPAPVETTGTHRFHDRVGVARQLEECFAPGIGAQVEYHAALAPADVQKEQRNTVDDRPRHLAAVVTLRRFDVDPVGGEIGGGRGERAGPCPLRLGGAGWRGGPRPTERSCKLDRAHGGAMRHRPVLRPAALAQPQRIEFPRRFEARLLHGGRGRPLGPGPASVATGGGRARARPTSRRGAAAERSAARCRCARTRAWRRSGRGRGTSPPAGPRGAACWRGRSSPRSRRCSSRA